MPMVYDIRSQIPQPVKLYEKPYEYQPYPRMMTYTDEKGRLKPYLDELKQPIAVHSEAEEKAFWASKEDDPAPVVEEPKMVSIPIAAVAPPRHTFEAMTPADAMKAAEKNETVAPKKRGRPAKLPANLK
jgi:hypothetical protein